MSNTDINTNPTPNPSLAIPSSTPTPSTSDPARGSIVSSTGLPPYHSSFSEASADTPASNMAPVKTPTIDNFDIVATYHRILASDPEITMPVAAIEALVEALHDVPATTVSETLDLLSTLTAELKSKIPNPISLSAGTDLFQRYMVATLQNPRGGSDYEMVRAHLVRNGKVFVERAKEARDSIAGFGKNFVRDGNTVLTNGGSRVVGALLRSAAEASRGSTSQGSIRFSVIYVVSKDSSSAESDQNIAALRSLGVPVATIPPTAIAYCMQQVTQCFVGAEGVVENGGIISRLGTYQIAILAKAMGKPFYVVSETHKFVRLYPLGQNDLGIEQNIVHFKTADDDEERPDSADSMRSSFSQQDEGVADLDVKSDPVAVNGLIENNSDVSDAVDFTPPRYISGIITESGVLLPSAVSEELIKIWF